MAVPSRNIEIKAKVLNIKDIISKAKQLSDSEEVKLNQKDTFYCCPNPNNRLKLREENGIGTLISYSRPDMKGPKLSQYQKCGVNNPGELSAVLTDALGTRGIVRKQRLLYIVGQTRIHIDQVEELGDFMELEVTLSPDQTVEEGQAIACQLMSQLGVTEQDLLAGAYMDMLLSQSS